LVQTKIWLINGDSFFSAMAVLLSFYIKWFSSKVHRKRSQVQGSAFRVQRSGLRVKDKEKTIS